LSGHDFHLEADLHMRFPFAAFGVTGGGGTKEPLQSAATMQGSLMYDPNGPSLLVSDRPQVRHGVIDIIPFLDTNNNGIRDPGEQIVKHFGLEQPAGRVTAQEDGTITISELEPYRRYVLKFSANEV